MRYVLCGATEPKRWRVSVWNNRGRNTTHKMKTNYKSTTNGGKLNNTDSDQMRCTVKATQRIYSETQTERQTARGEKDGTDYTE